MAKSKKFQGLDYVVSTNGVVDIEASGQAFKEALQEHLTKESVSSEKVLEMIQAKMKTASRVRSGTLIVSLAEALSGDEDDEDYSRRFGENHKLVKRVIHENTNRESAIDETKLFHIVRGPGGGMCTVATALALRDTEK